MAAPLFPNPDDYPGWKEWAQDLRRLTDAANLEGAPVAASPVLLATHRPEASAVTPGVLMYDAVNLEPTVSDGAQWGGLTPATGGGIRWVDGYVVDSDRRQGDMVRDEGWLMIANKDTSDRAAPVAAGTEAYESGYATTPTWLENLILDTFFITGQRYTFSTLVWLSSVRYWYPSSERQLTFELWLVTNPLVSPGISQVFGPFLPSADPAEEWNEFKLSPVPINAGVLDVVLVAKPNPIPVTVIGTWDQQNVDTAPIAGKMSWNNDETTLEFNDQDKNGTDQSMALADVIPGASLFVQGISFLVLTTVVNVGTVTYTVIPDLARPSSGNNRAFQFSYFVDGPLEYVEIVDHYLGHTGRADTVKGFLGAQYSFGIALNDNGYGIDIELDDAVGSADWDTAAYSSAISVFPS